MKKIIALILALVLIMAFAACGKVEITMQEVYESSQTESILKNHQSVYVRSYGMDGEIYGETYLTKEYVFEGSLDGEYIWADFMTDDACYSYMYGDYMRYVPITPDGVTDGYANYREEIYASFIVLSDAVNETIESVSKKDGRITVKSFLDQEELVDIADFGVISGKFEYVLDAKTREIISTAYEYGFDDGTVVGTSSEVSYDTEVPEMAKTLMEYANQTEDMRNITVVSNPGTEKEVSQSIQSPKGLVVDLRYDEFEAVFEAYTDAACTEAYDPYADADSDLTIYVTWTE